MPMPLLPRPPLRKDLRFILLSRFATPGRVLNAARAFLALKCTRKERVAHYPVSLTICTGNVCLLHCSLCPTGQGESGRERGFMEFGTFQRVIDECAPYIYAIELDNWGEPLLNPSIMEMIRYAKARKLHVTMSTTLTSTREHPAEDIVSSGLDVLIVSLAGASQETVQDYQVGVDFHRTVSLVAEIRRVRDSASRKHPLLVWRMLPTRSNEGELDKAARLYKVYGFDYLDVPLCFRCDMGRELTFTPSEQFLNVLPWLPREEALSQYDYTAQRRKKIPTRCRWLWCRSVINWNGAVAPCDGVWEEVYDFGSVRDQSFFSIWDGPQYWKARRAIAGGVAEAGSLICAICKKNEAILEW